MPQREKNELNMNRPQPPSAAAKSPSNMPAGAGSLSVTEKSGGEDLLQHARDTTGKVVDQVQQQASSRLNQQKDNAANDLKKLADAVRQMGDGLTGEQQGTIAQYAADYGRKAAENIERFTDYLRVNDAKALVRDFENFGRRQPAVLLGGAFLLGFAGARFLKSSTQPGTQPNEDRGLPQTRTSAAASRAAVT